MQQAAIRVFQQLTASFCGANVLFFTVFKTAQNNNFLSAISHRRKAGELM